MVPAAGCPREQVAVGEHRQRALRLGQRHPGEGGGGGHAHPGARADTEQPEQPPFRVAERAVGGVERGQHLWPDSVTGQRGRGPRRLSGPWDQGPRRLSGQRGQGPRRLSGPATEGHRAVPPDAAGGEADRERQPPAPLHGGADLLGVDRPGVPGDPPEQCDGLFHWQHVEWQDARAGGTGELAPGGDQYQALARFRQQRAELIVTARVIENHDGPAAGELRLPQRGPLREAVWYPGGGHPQHLEQPPQRLGGGERLARRVVGAQVEIQRPIRVPSGHEARGADGESCLPDPGHALDDRDAGDRRVLAREHAQFRAPAHEPGGLGREGVGRWCRAASPVGGGRAERGVAAQHPLMQLRQRWPWFAALLVDQQTAGLPVEAERVGAAATPAQRGHLVGDESFVERVAGEQLAELTHQVGVQALLQLTADPLADGGPAFLRQALPRARRPVAGQPGQRLPAPQRVRLPQQTGGMAVVTARGQRPRLPAQPPEPVHVDRVRVGFQQIATRAPDQPHPVAHSPPQ